VKKETFGIPGDRSRYPKVAYMLDALPVAQPTASKHLCQPGKSPNGDFPLLSYQLTVKETGFALFMLS